MSEHIPDEDLDAMLEEIEAGFEYEDEMREAEAVEAKAVSPRAAMARDLRKATDEECCAAINVIVNRYGKHFTLSSHWMLTMVSIMNKTNYHPPRFLHAVKGVENPLIEVVQSAVSVAMLDDLCVYVDAWAEKHKDDVAAEVEVFTSEEGGMSYSASKTVIEDASSSKEEGWASW